jgi:hypothetical protein
MELSKFKLEVDIFNEHFIHDDLYKLYDNERYFIQDENTITIEGEDSTIQLEGNLSSDNSFGIEHVRDTNTINIYVISALSPITKYLYMTIINVDPFWWYKMDGNLIYCGSTNNKFIIDILNKKIIRFNTDQKYPSYFSYQNSTCFVSINNIEIHTGDKIFEVKCELNFGDNYSQDKSLSETGKFYLTGPKRVYEVNLKENKVTSKAHNFGRLKQVYLTPYGKVFILRKQIFLPSGKSFSAKDFYFEGQDLGYEKSFIVLVSSNKYGNKLICSIKLVKPGDHWGRNIILIINLKDEVVIKQINIEGDDKHKLKKIGFLDTYYIEKLEPTVLDFSTLEGF